MSAWLQVAMQVAVVVVVLAAVHRPLGDHLARTFTSAPHLRVERWLYRLIRVDPDADQRWTAYLGSVLAFSAVSVLGLYALLRLQQHLPLALGRPPMPAAQAWNTAVSFATNTSWQSYAGETALGHLAQMAGIAVQAFLSAAVGLAVAVALVRGLVARETDRVGNFWSDLVRGLVRVLLPLSLVGAVLLLAGGVVQNLHGFRQVATLAGHPQLLPGGPVASYEPIKLMSGDGGGFWNANSAHPFENPNPLTNILEIVLMLLVPSALPRMYGRMVGSLRQGWTVLAVMAVLWFAAVGAATAAEVHHAGPVPRAVASADEGKEVRFGVPATALFGVSSTATADGAVDGAHDSFTALGGGLLLANMVLGEVSPGGIGSGLYGVLALALLAVFLAGLMIGRTPEFLGKRVGSREIRLVALLTLVTPVTLLVGAAVAMSLPTGRSSMLNQGAHGLSEVVYAFTSAANTNGSAFAGLNANTDFYNVSLGLVMLAGRYLPMVLTVALAGAFAGQRRTATTAGTLPTTGPLFAALVIGVALVVAALTFLPAMALGPLGEGLR